MKYLQGAIIIVPIPFTDLSSSKLRPCVVISNTKIARRDDCIVLAITSNPEAKKLPDSFTVTSDVLADGFIPKTSYIRTQKVFTIHKRLIKKEIARLNKKSLAAVLRIFRTLIEP